MASGPRGGICSAREALHGVRKGAGHRVTAGRIAEKHGSRKAGMPMTGAKTGARRRPDNSAQLTLDL